MKPVTASATQLPFQDKEFDAVIASDVLEHIPPELRATVVSECLRVTRRIVIFGFPCGQLAWQCDRSLLDAYTQAGRTPPGWLTEHMDAPFPEADLLSKADGWNVESMGNENIDFHSWLMRKEISQIFVLFSSACMRIAPTLVEYLLRRKDKHGPYYRRIFALRRSGSAS